MGYLTIVLLAGLVGGVAMGAIAGARRTQSAFPAYLTATDASDLQLQASSNVAPFGSRQIKNLDFQLARLPNVTRVAVAPNLFVVPFESNGRPNPSLVNNDDVTAIGSDNGAYFSQDRITVAEGRMADPKNPSEMVATAEAAKIAGWHLGETVPFGSYALQQAESPTFSFTTTKPSLRFTAKLVGLVVFSSQVVDDDVDRFPTYVLLTPALTQRLRSAEVYPSFGLRLAHGNADVPKVEKEIIRLLPRGTTYTFHVTSVGEAQVERSSKPEAIALGVFGGIAGLATLLIVGLAIGRGIGAQGDDLDALRGLGAGPLTLTWDVAFGVLGATVIGAIVAVGVAIALSPLTPIGPARQVDAHPGFTTDWTVLVSGFLVLLLGLASVTAVLANRTVARRRLRQRSDTVGRGSTVVNASSRAGLPPSAVAGLRFALERGFGRSAVPVRAALVGAILAVVVVVTTITFASGLNTLESHPALYGWNWNYAINSAGGSSVPPAAASRLSHDPDVAAWTGYNFAGVQINGQTVPVLLSQPRATLSPPILSGHPLDSNNQIVLGAATLAALHTKIGDKVDVSYGSPGDAPVYVAPTPLRVVGTATFPAIGESGALHTSMGTGAMISVDIGSAAFRRAIRQSDPNLNGMDIDVVRLRSGVTPQAGLASLHKVAIAANEIMAGDPQGQGDVYQVIGVQRPAEIVNYQSTGATPAILSAGLAGGAIVALGLTLGTSVRRRRRDLALLKTLGFTRRQLATAIVWQASVAAIIGIAVGVPIGIALGRWLWVLFARGIYAVTRPSVPVVEILVVALGALVLANLAAAIPGRMAARTRTALVLRTE